MRLVLGVLVLAACQSASAREEPPKSVDHDVAVLFHMRQKFELVRAAEMLIVRGRLDEARPLVRSVIEGPEDPSLEVWGRQALYVRNALAAVVNAKTVPDAARGIARVAHACAECHTAAGAVPKLAPPPALPPDGETIEARMARHRWAADRLWESMVFGADDMWRAGLDVLAAAPLPVFGDRAVFAHRLQHVARDARIRMSTETASERTRTYGEILVTCTTCHATDVREPH